MPGSGWLGSRWRRAVRSSCERRWLHSCSSCSRDVIVSQRPRPRGPRTAQPAGEGGVGLRELLRQAEAGSSRGQCRHQGTLKPVSFFTNVALRKMTSSEAPRTLHRQKPSKSPVML